MASDNSPILGKNIPFDLLKLKLAIGIRAQVRLGEEGKICPNFKLQQ